MTNLIATLIITFTTNWTTVSTTYTTCTSVGCLVYHPPMQHQVGSVFSNIVAVINWKGNDLRLMLESYITERIERDTYANDAYTLTPAFGRLQ